MRRAAFAALASVALIAAPLHPSAAQNTTAREANRHVVLKYMGAAGWEISDGTTVILIDPYLSRINGPQPPGNPYSPPPGDTRPLYGWDDIAVPDTVATDSHIQRADFILVTHTHYDHDLDVPHIAVKTRATVIGTESTENVMRAYRVPEGQLITVRGGEDYEFGRSPSGSFPAFTAPSITSTISAPNELRRV
jgi:L-ascorbate metabolism protein UlaG (beta-lactamase superfamily)